MVNSSQNLFLYVAMHAYKAVAILGDFLHTTKEQSVNKIHAGLILVYLIRNTSLL